MQSEWIAKAVAEGRFLEGTTDVIVINDDNPEAVKALAKYMYTGDYALPAKSAYEQMIGFVDSMHSDPCIKD